KYSTPGIKTIQLILTYSGGATCTTTQQVQAHPLPNAAMSINASSNYCLSKNMVCVDDLSTPGTTGSAIVKRVVLFGDGFADISFNPGANKQICHSYNRDGNYTITLEVTDSKGCIKHVQTTVTVVRDVKALYGYNLYGNCDTASLCMFNLTQADSSVMSKWYWDFGNGDIDSVNWKNTCKVFRDSGSYSPRLIIHSVNGCSDTFQQNGLINLDPIEFDVVKDKYMDCYGSTWTFEDKGPTKDKYYWYYRDSLDQISHPLGEGNPFSTSAFEPGKKYVTVTVHRGKCISTFLKDSVLVRGPVADAKIRNKSICVQGDTTYFCDDSDYRATIGIKRIWDFGDQWCAPCTTDTKNGINVGANCRYSVDPSPKHLYTVDTCYTTSLKLEDTVTGCKWTETFGIQVGAPKPETIVFNYSNDKACTGLAVDRTFGFYLQGNCYNFQVNPDSAAPNSGFYNQLQTWNYANLSQPSGFVTVGLILESGSPVSANCPGITMSPFCRDTIWYHNWIHIIEEPDPAFTLSATHGCAPFSMKAMLSDTSDTTLVMAIWEWGDGQTDTQTIVSGTLMQQDFPHTYLQNGQFDVKLTLVNNRGCERVSSERLSVGHKNVFEFKQEPCINECLTFHDSTQYYGDTTYYWNDLNRLASGKERMWWTFSDGDTFSSTHPQKCFNDTGWYTITLITLDSSGCYDTSSASLEIGGIKAGITAKDVILCTEIVQFFDSSIYLNNNASEGILSWYWEFGDGTTPSYLQDPYHFYSSFGEFEVRLIIYTNRDCIDTAIKKVRVEGPLPSFEFVTDSIGCVPFEIELKNVSQKVKNWIWYFGDSANTTFATLTDSNVTFRYTKPGTYYLQLYGADSIYNPATQNNQYCAFTYPDTLRPGQIARKVVVLPIEPVGFLAPDTICRDIPFFLEHTGSPKYTQFLWIQNDRDSLSTTVPKLQYQLADTGWHKFAYHPSYIPGPQDRACFDSAVRNIYVVGLEADFDFDPRSTPLEIYFDNLSTGANRYFWDFGHPASGKKNYYNQVFAVHRYYPE
ncbi:MAG: PKD domain-containing protein, partial [Bacteroidota bacterium]|nr:PKD domain-containing protein [Bacteroidota bacterium]MDX5430911.1 PKD domain-containing protein [Bacteroidota bacterium]MDX5469658.1 PKD domain-containing protein [Bacteroidota bacterium]